MREHRLVSNLLIPRPRTEVFSFFSDAANLERITPPWLKFSILTPLPIRMREGAEIEYRIRLRGVPLRWRTLISEWDPPHRFVDEQASGPYRLWHHSHAFLDERTRDGQPVTRMIDTVRYALPLGPLGELARRLFVRRDLERIFGFRRECIGRLMAPAERPSRIGRLIVR